MSGTIVLKNERGKFRYYLNDDKGNTVFTGPFVSNKELAVSYIEKLTTLDTLADHLQLMKGPDGSWVLRGEVQTAREGEKGAIAPATPLGFSPTFEKEADAVKARDNIVKLAKGATTKDEA